MKKGVAQISDAIFAVGFFMAIMAAIIIPLSNYLLDQTKATHAATHAKRVKNAVEKYVKDNHDAITARATPSSPYIFGINELINAGYLPTGFSDKNGFSAQYQTRVYQTTAKKLHTMTYLTGGALSKSLARKLAIGIGAEGGIIEGNEALGVLGSWRFNLVSLGGFNPGEGTVVIAGFYEDGVVVSDYLYRKAVAGHPELNTMRTALNMSGNDVDNGGWFKSTGKKGWMNDTYQGGFYMDDKGVIKTTSETGIYSTGRITTDEFIELKKVSVAGEACQSNGLVSRDANGGILSCQSGVWTAPDGIGKYTTYMAETGQLNPRPLGKHKFCALTGMSIPATPKTAACLLNVSSDSQWYLTHEPTGYSNGYCTTICF